MGGGGGLSSSGGSGGGSSAGNGGGDGGLGGGGGADAGVLPLAADGTSFTLFVSFVLTVGVDELV